MTASLSLLIVLLAGAPEAPKPANAVRLYSFSPKLEAAIRGQSPITYAPVPPIMLAQGGNPYGSPTYNQDPFSPGFQDPAQGYYPQPLSNQVPGGVYGVNGPQPYRMGWTPRFDLGYLAPAAVRGNATGQLEVIEAGTELRYSTLIGDSIVFSSAGQFAYRSFDGPQPPPVGLQTSLPANVYRFGWDLALETTPVGGLSFKAGFNPSINTDLNASIESEALQFDGSLAAYYRSSPELLWVLGVIYWDRRQDFILPNVGVVWNPTQLLELRLLFPKSQASYFLGNFWNGSHWLYASGEFHVEAYQVDSASNSREQAQFRDWRVMLGLRSDHPTYEKFIEVGAVLGRQVTFKESGYNFDVADGFIARMGLRF